jgi:glycosyltransferase involved in cell wall biosynthesis
MQAFAPGLVEGHAFGTGPAAYVDLLRRIDAQGFIQFHGPYALDALPDVLRGVDVVVVPSICEETAGLVVLEALAARVPVVVSRIGGLPEFVREGVDGFTFHPRDAVDLAHALHRFGRDPALLGRMQRAILPPRPFGTFLDELIAHYREVVAIRASKV